MLAYNINLLYKKWYIYVNYDLGRYIHTELNVVKTFFLIFLSNKERKILLV